MMAPRDKVQHHIPELKCVFQTANVFPLLFLNTEMKKDRPSPYMVNNKSENKRPSQVKENSQLFHAACITRSTIMLQRAQSHT